MPPAVTLKFVVALLEIEVGCVWVSLLALILSGVILTFLADSTLYVNWLVPSVEPPSNFIVKGCLPSIFWICFPAFTSTRCQPE